MNTPYKDKNNHPIFLGDIIQLQNKKGKKALYKIVFKQYNDGEEYYDWYHYGFIGEKISGANEFSNKITLPDLALKYKNILIQYNT